MIVISHCQFLLSGNGLFRIDIRTVAHLLLRQTGAADSISPIRQLQCGDWKDHVLPA